MFSETTTVLSVGNKSVSKLSSDCSQTPTRFDTAPSYPYSSAQLEVEHPFVGPVLGMEMQFHKPSVAGLWLAMSTKVFWRTFN